MVRLVIGTVVETVIGTIGRRTPGSKPTPAHTTNKTNMTLHMIDSPSARTPGDHEAPEWADQCIGSIFRLSNATRRAIARDRNVRLRRCVSTEHRSPRWLQATGPARPRAADSSRPFATGVVDNSARHGSSAPT